MIPRFLFVFTRLILRLRLLRKNLPNRERVSVEKALVRSVRAEIVLPDVLDKLLGVLLDGDNRLTVRGEGESEVEKEPDFIDELLGISFKIPVELGDDAEGE